MQFFEFWLEIGTSLCRGNDAISLCNGTIAHLRLLDRYVDAQRELISINTAPSLCLIVFLFILVNFITICVPQSMSSLRPHSTLR